jgi:hypothetical protein
MDRWFRELMNEIATLQEKPQRFTLMVKMKFSHKKSTNRCTENLKMYTEFLLQSET